MSECSTATETPSSGEQEPTMVSVPVVGSSATDNMATSWDSGTTLHIQDSSSDLCNITLCNSEPIPSPTSASITPASQMQSAISHGDVIQQETSDHSAFIHSEITQDPDSTSGSLGVCEEERMIVDGPLTSSLSVHSITTPEHISVSHESDNSEDHINVMDNIAAQNFLHESELLNAATSALHNPKTSPTHDSDLSKTSIQHSLISSLEQQSVSSSQEPEPMEMQSLLHDQQGLEGRSVSSMADYHLDHSQASELSVGSTSQMDIGVVLPSGMRADSVCLSPSSTSSTSSLDLPSSSCTTSGIGLPPVSTIIRSSASYAKGRFVPFCRPSNINMIMDIPQFLNNSSSFDGMSSINSIQRMASSPCDNLAPVSLASPLEVSSRHDTCADIPMESVEVPLSSSLVCSSSSSDHIATAVESGCIKPTSSVMSSMGPDMVSKQNSSELAESQMQSEDGVTLRYTEGSPLPPYVEPIPMRHMINMGTSSTQVSLNLPSPLRIEDMHQKVEAINEHLRSETPVSTTYTLGNSDEPLAHEIVPATFNCRAEIETDSFQEELSQTSQPPALLPVSAIETNVIMSTSNIDSVLKLSNAEIKVIENSHRLTEEQLQSLQRNHRIENSGVSAEIIIPHSIRVVRNSSSGYSSVQNMLHGNIRDMADFASSEKTPSPEVLQSRSSIIEKSISQQPQVIKSEDSVESNMGSEMVSAVGSPVLSAVHADGDTMVTKVSSKLQSRVILDESRGEPLVTVSPSAVTASVIQQLLKAQNPPTKLTPIMQHIPGGVITSVMSVKRDSCSDRRDSSLITASSEQGNFDMKSDMSDLAVATSIATQNSMLVNISGEKSSLNFTEASLDNRDKSPILTSSMQNDKDLPNLASVALPTLFSNLSSSTLASLQSSLSSALPAIPLTIQSLPSVTTATSASLLSNMQSGLVSPLISSVPPIILPSIPSILSSTLRNAASTIKSSIRDSVSSSNSISPVNSSVYSGLLKSVGLSTIVKQEPGVPSGSGSLPPFTVVSGLSPLVNRELSATLATTLLGANHSSSQIPVVTVKQEPGLNAVKASASEFTTSAILSAGSALPSVASMQLPSVSHAELSVVTSSSSAAAVAASTSLTSPVPSQASTIAFAGNASPEPSTSASAVSVNSSVKEDKTVDKKWDCPMCKNGSPCGLHPTQPQASSSQTVPQPLLSGDPAKPFQCTLCGKHLASKNVYQLHLRSHSGEKPFTCNLCGHHFSQKTSLTRHMRSHTGERPFPCDVCGKRFADKERIKIHMRTHTGEKPFACEVCGKRFSQKSTVKRHMSVHTGEKPFKCEACGKGFANRGNLNAHSKTHANT